MANKTGSEIFIVDNSDVDWKVLHYLHDWCQLAKGLAAQYSGNPSRKLSIHGVEKTDETGRRCRLKLAVD